MTEQTRATTGQLRQGLDEIILNLQRLRDGTSEESSAGGVAAGQEGSTASNGCSTYSVHCGTPPQVVDR